MTRIEVLEGGDTMKPCKNCEDWDCEGCPCEMCSAKSCNKCEQHKE